MSDATRVVGRYEVIGRPIGRGGMARVYRARDTVLGRIVALKELDVFEGMDPTHVDRFVQDAQLVASLAHKNVVVVYDYFEAAGIPYIAMEYVSGGSLRRYLSSSLTLAQVAGVLEGVLAGLAEAERNHIVHRDMKPENVLVSASGEVKITDFGIAKAANAASLTMTGVAVGTPSYMAPEQAQGGEIGAWTDLYATGVMAFEMLAGRPPFAADELPAILHAHIVEPVPDCPGLDGRLNGWLRTMLAKAPADRPRRAPEAWNALEAIVDDILGPRWRRESLLEPDALAVAAAAQAQAPTTSGYIDVEPPIDTNERIRRAARSLQADHRPPPVQPEIQLASTRAPAILEPTRRLQRPRRRWKRRVASSIGATALAGIIASALLQGSHDPRDKAAGGPTTTPSAQPRLGPQMSAAQLEAVLVPKSAYWKLPGVRNGGIQADSDSYALQGGLASLKLCGKAIRVGGLGADSSSSYESVTVLPGDIYFGSDAASFSGAGARQLLTAAASQNCKWRRLPGPRLGDQVVRLTADQKGPEDTTLHDDVILVRRGAAVVEIGTAVFSGTHSADAERLAESAAHRLVHAVHKARS